MSKDFQTIVVGLGAMGSAALYQLAKRHVKVLGVDRLSPPHTLGSTHGDTRITRQAIGEGAHYTPLSLRSYEIFREVEQKTGRDLLQITGGLIITSKTKETSTNRLPAYLDNMLFAAKKNGIKHEILSSEDIKAKFPQFNVSDDQVGYYEYEAGFLRPEDCIRSQLELARELGASLHTNELVQRFEESENGVTVYTDQDTYKADNMVLSVGPWLPDTIPQLRSIFKVHRQVLNWFDVSAVFDQFVPGKFPIFIWHLKGFPTGIYGFPAVNGLTGGIKIATEAFSATVTPENVNRVVSPEETAEMFDRKVAPYLPQIGRQCVKSTVCLYTATEDSGFVIDWMPSSKRVIVCSPCSGHGFKHSAAIGECVAELASTGKTSIDISLLNIVRLLSESNK